MSITEGAVAYTVGRDGARMAACPNGVLNPIYACKAYVARRRVKDGALTWRCDYSALGLWGRMMRTATGTYGGPSSPLVEEAIATAEADGVIYIENLRHGRAVKEG